MSTKLVRFDEPRTIFRHVLTTVLVIVSLSASCHGQDSSSKSLELVLQQSPASGQSRMQSVRLQSREGGTPAAISERDLSPDVLATAMPVSALPGKQNPGSHLGEETLHLRSSSNNITGIGRYILFALPIFSSDLRALLAYAQADLQTRVGDQVASSYECNTTKWSLSVILQANTTLQYAAFQATITRFLKLSSSISTTPDEIVSTRVGVIFNGSTPIADIAILPHQFLTNTSYTPFSNFHPKPNLSLSSSSEPIEIMKISPHGSTCIYQPLNETTALSPFLHPLLSLPTPSLHPRRSLEAEILVRISETAFAMSMHLWQRPHDGLPVQVKIWALKALFHIARWQILGAALLTASGIDILGNRDGVRSFDEDTGLDTGFYMLGHLVGRLLVEVIDMVAGVFNLAIWGEIVEVFLGGLRGEEEQGDGWAMEGEIFGPGGGHGNTTEGGEAGEGGMVVVARWQVWVGDYDEA